MGGEHARSAAGHGSVSVTLQDQGLARLRGGCRQAQQLTHIPIAPGAAQRAEARAGAKLWGLEACYSQARCHHHQQNIKGKLSEKCCLEVQLPITSAAAAPSASWAAAAAPCAHSKYSLPLTRSITSSPLAHLQQQGKTRKLRGWPVPSMLWVDTCVPHGGSRRTLGPSQHPSYRAHRSSRQLRTRAHAS